jgi:DNA-directed RNA polymerase specialized sigma24 family protein
MPTQDDIERQQQILDAHRATLAHYLIQRAQLGADYAPPGVTNGINEARAGIAHCKAALHKLSVDVEDLPDDLEAATTPEARRVPRMLREPAPDFVGRVEEIEQLTRAVLQAARQGAVAAITGVRGMGGVGKSELAYAVAQRLAPHFPDGQLLIELQGASSPLEVEGALRRLLIALGETVELQQLDLPTLQGRYRSALYGKRLLILADDAGDAQQARPLMPPAGCALLITSRHRFVLPGMTTLDLRTLPPADAERLVIDICPRIGGQAAELARLCGYLPLALRVSASLLATNDDLPVPVYLARLADERTRLAQLRDPDMPDLDVEASLRLSYDALDSAAQQALYIMSTFPLNFSAQLVAAIIPNEPEAILQRLRRRSLIEWDATTSRYSLHDLIRVLALQQKEATAEMIGVLPKDPQLVYTVLDALSTFQAWRAATEEEIRNSLGLQYRTEMEQLWNFLADDLRRVAHGWLRSGLAPDIETLALDMFSHIVFALPRLKIDPHGNVRAFLITVARHGMTDDYRRSYTSSPNSRPNMVVSFDEQTSEKDAARSDVEREMSEKIDNQRILAAAKEYWKTLGPDDTIIMQLHWQTDPPRSFRAIVEQLGGGWVEDAVRLRHRRIMNATRKYLREQGAIE